MPKPLIIVPSYNTNPASTHQLIYSLQSQANQDFRVIFAVDKCQKSLDSIIQATKKINPSFEYCIKFSSRRRFALANIVITLFAAKYIDTSWVGILDGDDHLLSSDVIDIFNFEYLQGANVAWSSFLWDGQPSNVSQAFPQRTDPYKYPWVSSHFKTFSYNLFLSVPISNYLDADGNFLRRCYDHALMLPLLWLCRTHNLRTKHIPQPLYYYNNSNSSIPASEHTRGSLESHIAQFIRSRGYVS